MSKKMKRLTEKARIKWCYSFKTSKRWLTAIKVDKSGSRHTEREYSRAIYTFCQWIDKNPDQLITQRKHEIKNEDTKHNTEDKVREFCLMLQNTRDITKSTIVTKYHAPIKSFFSYNDLPLKLKTPKYAKRRREPHTTEEIKKLMMVSDVREKAIMMLLKDSGLSRQDVVELTYKQVKNGLETNEQIIHIRSLRRKELIEHDTFIGKNAIEHLKAYIDYRKRVGHQINEDSRLIATLSGKPLTPETLSVIFSRLTKKVGFKTSPHRFRKYFESHMGLNAPSLLIKYWMGHSLGVETSYFLPPLPKQRTKYAEGYKELDIFKPKVDEREMRINAMLDNARLMNWTEEKLFAFEDFLRKPTVRAKAIPLENMVKEFLKLYNEAQDCQKMINPKELETYLKNGWHYIAQVNGKIVIESNGSND